MPKMTVHVPDDLLKKFREKRPEIKVAEIVRRGIIRRLEELEKFEDLKKRGKV